MNSGAKSLLKPAVWAPSLAAVIGILALNLSETDFYFGGTTEKPTDPPPLTMGLPPGISREVVCPCACEHCHHLARVESAATIYQIDDADGWYRLFWAGDDTYYFTDVSYFLTALENRTWRQATGWRVLVIAFERSCPEEEPRHECSKETLSRVTLTYRLVLGGPGAVPSMPMTDPKGLATLPAALPGEAMRLYEGHFRGESQAAVLTLGWVLDGPPRVEYASCACGR